MVNFTGSAEINRDTPIPLYYQVAQILRKEIETGKYQPGDYIPTELELQRRFNVSRATIRQAIADMVYAGLLERRRSKGTTVSTRQFESTLHGLNSFTGEIMPSNLTLRTKILEFKQIAVPEAARTGLELSPGEMVAMMERIRYVDGQPMVLEKWYAPMKYFAGLERDMFQETGLEQSTYYVMVKRFGMTITRAEDIIIPVAIEPREAKLLNVASGMPVLLRTRISFNAEGRPVNLAIGQYLVRLRFILEGNRTYSSGH